MDLRLILNEKYNEKTHQNDGVQINSTQIKKIE